MSLKHFHILFITVSVILTVSFGAWAVRMHAQEPGSAYLVMGILSLVAGAGLVVYGVWFLRKIGRLNGS